MQKIQGIKGVKDVLPNEAIIWQHIQNKAREVFHTFGYSEIIIPVLESSELFLRSIGEATDIVEKEMYLFDDKDGKKVALRPEGTASVVRSYVEHNIAQSAPFSKLYYIGPMFRRERPQAGRYRQFYQIGAEVFGFSSARIDAEMLFMLDLFFKSLNIKGVELQVNSIGCPQCRPAFRESLRNYFSDKLASLCENCQRRFELNPLRILDCKSAHCHSISEDAPKTLDYLCDGCLRHFNTLQESLIVSGVLYTINQRLVRGLDYYTRTTFEFVSSALGAQNAVAAGGRYDSLVKDLGGTDTPAIGFSIGFERLITNFDSSSVKQRAPHVFIAAIGEQAQEKAFQIISQLHINGISAITDYDGGSLKSQMRKADKFNADIVLIIGEDELSRGIAVLRDMKNKIQEEVLIKDINDKLQSSNVK